MVPLSAPNKCELDGLSRRLALPGTPPAIPVIDLLLRQAQISEVGMQQIV